MWRLVLGLRSRDDELHGRRSAGNRRFGALDHIKLRRYLDWLTTSPLKNTQSLTSAARSLPPPPPCTLCTSQASWPRAARYASRGCRGRLPRRACQSSCSGVCICASELDGADRTKPPTDFAWVFLIHVKEVRHHWLHHRFAFVIRRHRNRTAKYLQRATVPVFDDIV